MIKRGAAVLALVLVATFAAPAGFAGEFDIKADIPFDFIAGNVILPAGTYRVVPTTTPGVLVMRPESGGQGVLFQTRGVMRAHRAASPQLDFNRYGNKYCLAKVWSANEDGRIVPQSKLERELRAGALRTVPPTTTIAAVLVR